MLKILTFVVPFLLKGTAKNPAKTLAGHSVFYGLIFLGTLFLLFAMFTGLLKTYSLEVAFLGTGLILLSGALIIKVLLLRARATPKSALQGLPHSLENDALAAHIPEGLKDDPLLKKILVEISEKPLAATVTALTVGVLLSREYFD